MPNSIDFHTTAGAVQNIRFSLALVTSVLFFAVPSICGSSSGGGGTVWVTPHDSYSSSVGVLGCKVDTNRIAYWPDSVDCDNICVRLSFSYDGGTRSVLLLRIDQSQGAHDVSYDAWNYLTTGYSARDKPSAGGAIAMEYENLSASECVQSGLIHVDGLPLSAANSMNFVANCVLNRADSWVANNYALYNILDPICNYGFDEECKFDGFAKGNQATCPHALGTPAVLTTAPVYNIRYPTGQQVLAGGNEPVAPGIWSPSSVSTIRLGSGARLVWLVGVCTWVIMSILLIG